MNIENTHIDISCPECEFSNTITLNDVINQSSLICVGCLKTIQLTDGDGETKRAISEVNQSLRDLGKAFKSGR